MARAVRPGTVLARAVLRGFRLSWAVGAWTAARMTRAERPSACPSRRSLAVSRTRLARSERSCLPGTGTVLGCFRAIRIAAARGIRISVWVRLPVRAVATTSIGSELTRFELPGTGLSWSERPWSGWSRSGWSRSELLPAGRARSVVARPVLVWAVLARMLLLTRLAPTVPGSASAVGLPLPPSAWSVPRAFPSRPATGPARRPATGIRPVGRGAVEPV